jgi:energy-converting hydrogenase Eha subunit E
MIRGRDRATTRIISHRVLGARILTSRAFIMTRLDVQSEFAPPSRAGGSRGLIRWVCTSNPFYVLSALLVCLGLWVSFGSQVDASQTWALLFGMASYTLLLAVTACLLVRFVGVWDDVRTVLLLVVLMFLATSVTFDEVLARSPARGIACYLGGFLFAVAVSEGMLRGIRLHLPPLFRTPYYLALALFFLYPVAITPLLDRPRSESLSWAMFGFSPAAGLVFLTLLPAIRRGRDYVRDNGSPWGWAWYPWTLFGVLAFGVAARSALLCWSMHHIPLAETEPYIFGLYFLVPFGLTIAVILLEIGRVERRRGVLLAALFLPAILLFLTVVGHRTDPTYQWFLGRFIARLGGTPLSLTLLASTGFYAYAALRRVPMAFDALTAAMVALAFIGPHTLDLGGLVPPRALPILTAAIVQTAIGLRRRDAWRCLIGTGCLVASTMIALRPIGAAGHQGPIAFHLVLTAVLVLGAAFNDRLGHVLRTTGAAMALLGSLVVLTGQIDRTGLIASWAIEVYPLGMSLMIVGYGFVLGHRTSLASAGLIVSAWLAAVGYRGYGSLRQVVAGIDYIAMGMVLFSLAVLTSMAKGGVQPWKMMDRRGKLPNAPD